MLGVFGRVYEVPNVAVRRILVLIRRVYGVNTVFRGGNRTGFMLHDVLPVCGVIYNVW